MLDDAGEGDPPLPREWFVVALDAHEPPRHCEAHQSYLLDQRPGGEGRLPDRQTAVIGRNTMMPIRIEARIAQLGDRPLSQAGHSGSSRRSTEPA